MDFFLFFNSFFFTFSMLILLLLLFPWLFGLWGNFLVLLSISLSICSPFLLCLRWGLRFMCFQPKNSVGGQERGKGQAGGSLDVKASPGLSRWKDLADSPRDLVPSLSKSVWRAPRGTHATRKVSSAPH